MHSLLSTLLKSFWRAEVRRSLLSLNRALPFGDYVVDRWEKAFALGFPEGVSVYDSSLILGDVAVGKGTWIGPFTVIDGTGGLVIGRDCAISSGVQIYTHDSVLNIATDRAHHIEKKSTRIGSNCYIGPNCVVAMGVTIGDNVVVGANSFVNTDLPSNVFAYGTPCRVQTTLKSYLDKKLPGGVEHRG